MLLKDATRFVRTRVDDVRAAWRRIRCASDGIRLPPRFALGTGTRFVVLEESEILLANELNLGDLNLLKFYKPGSRLVAGRKLTTRQGCIFQLFGGELVVGDNVFFNNHCSISCLGKITIGDDTFFGEGVKMYDHNHKYEFRDGRLYPMPLDFKIGEISIGKNCWIASDVTILCNVTIGDNVIIGAGCLIRKPVPPNTIVLRNEELIFKQAPA